MTTPRRQISTPNLDAKSRRQISTPYEMGHDDNQYLRAKIMDVAERASSADALAAWFQVVLRADRDSAVRYWAALGLLIRGEAGVFVGRDPLRAALSD